MIGFPSKILNDESIIEDRHTIHRLILIKKGNREEIGTE